MLTLGIDPGTAIMGYGLVDGGVAVSGVGGLPGSEELGLVEYGALRTPANAPMAERLPMLYDGLIELMKEYKPGTVAIEELFFNKNVRTALTAPPPQL